jgi:Spx/MgsR family transcriptional regulator
MLTLYGLKNCDTCRKARKWLDGGGIPYQFHDVREGGVNRAMLQRWADAVGWQTLLNRRSTTWRSLPDAAKHEIDEQQAIELMLGQPTLIKRPVAESGAQVLVGFSAARHESLRQPNDGGR